MSTPTFVYSKDALTDTEISVDVSALLKYGETLVSITPQVVSPVTTPALTITQTSANNVTPTILLMRGGAPNVAYGFQLLITTNARQLAVVVAVTVQTDVMVPYTQQDPDSYVDLVDTIQSGSAAISTAVFQFPASLDPSGGYVNWEFLDAAGIVYANGNAFDYKIQSNGLSNVVLARSVVSVPSTVPPSDVNSKYQIRTTLTLPGSIDPATGNPDQQTFYSYENVTVTGLSTVPTGTQSAIELQGNPATLSIIIDGLYDTVQVQLYQDNTLLASANINTYARVASGYYYAGTFDTSALPVSLEPYTIVWNYSNTSNPSAVYSESSNLWITNPTIMTAVSDVLSKINKARTTLYGTPDLLFPPTTIMTWLRRARDNFNGGPGGFTSFTFTNAKSAIREYWLMYAELLAIESQYMAEGEKAFDFSGAAISLNVDRTGYLDNAAGKIQARLDSELKAFRQNLIMKGATSGDGSLDPSKLQRGAIGSVGITITPASPWGPYRAGLPYPYVNGLL